MQTSDGVPTGRLAMAIQNLKQTLNDFHNDLDRGERAFEQWRCGWSARENCIERRLAALHSRVNSTKAKRRLRLAVLDVE